MKKIAKISLILSLLGFLLTGLNNEVNAASNYPENYMYAVQPGDTIYIIAEKHGITVKDILWYNKIANPDMIFVGQKIFIPAKWLITADKIMIEGYKYIGTTYQYGAPSGETTTFDCSSYTQYIYGTQGIKLPRTSREQSLLGTYVSRDKLRKGDLVFFTNDSRKDLTGIERIGHVAMYIGNDKLLHVPTTNGVTISEFEGNSYWRNYYVTSRRVLNF